VKYTEEKTFLLRFSLAATFDDGEPGDPPDGFAWLADWEAQLKPAVLQAVFRTLRAHPGFRVHARSRGASAEDEVEIVVERTASPDGSPRPR